MKTYKKLEKGLRRLGFEQTHQAKHISFVNKSGKKVVIPKKQSKDIDKFLFLRIVKEIGLTINEFEKII
jgi:predicted RNA binding protein YcfA (HicA-like mRNA interferase family)